MVRLDQPQSFDAQSSTEEVADVLGAMQRVHEWSKLFDDTRFLSAFDHDGCWQASKKVVAHQTSGDWSLVESPTCSESRFVVPLQFLTFMVVTKQYWAEGSIHFGGDVPPSRFNAVAAQVEHDAQIGNTRVCELHAFCGVDKGPLHVLRIVLLVFGKFEPREYVVHRSDGGDESSLKRLWV